MMSRATVFLSVLVTSLTHPAFPYLWAATAEPTPAVSLVAAAVMEPASEVSSSSRAETPVQVRFMALQAAVRSRSGELDARDRQWTESRIEAAGRLVDSQAYSNPTAVARRVATEFGIDSEVLLAQKQKLGAWWSEIVVIHTLLASAPKGLYADELLMLRKSGSSWSEIAHGLGFEIRPFANAALMECRVAAGQAEADGKVETLRTKRELPTATPEAMSWIGEPASWSARIPDLGEHLYAR